MVQKKLVSEGLDNLRVKAQVDLLDAIDTLRSQGISQHVSLPQIIVCGDQSSGKSSVLEAISGIPFPVRSNLCTRFPTEVILRKADHVGVRISIVPHHSRSQTERTSLSDFSEDLESFEDFPVLIDNAKAAMGIMTLGKAFARDILRIEIEGPDRPQLTIVDLPGLIHSENKQQSESDIRLITDMVTDYMQQPRSVILAVVSAKNDYANQIVLKLARQADRVGSRTLGIITKPDMLVAGSESEKTYISLATNQDINFRLGWHVLRNTDTDTDGYSSLEQRDRVESNFFSSSPAWGRLSPTTTGISSLRTRLSELLLQQIGHELPALLQEITAKSAICQTQLTQLGDPRTSAHEQRVHLVKISQSFHSLIQAAIDGSYDDPFFDAPESTSGYRKRFRAVVQGLSRTFAEEMLSSGHKWPIGVDFPDSRKLFLEKVTSMIDRVRGRELPGMLNPMVISDLFKEQSSPWGELARRHIDTLRTAALGFLNLLVEHVADSTTSRAILEKIVWPAMDETRRELEAKVEDLLKPHRMAHPITYKHSFPQELDKIRHRRQRNQFKAILQSENLDDPRNYGSDGRTERLLNRLMVTPKQDANEQVAFEAMDCLEAYYTVALERFIDDVSVQVVEMCLIACMRDLLSPLSISLMTSEQVADIAGENQETHEIRKALQAKLDVLQKGAGMCQRFVGSILHAEDEVQTDRMKGKEETLTEETCCDTEPKVTLSARMKGEEEAVKETDCQDREPELAFPSPPVDVEEISSANVVVDDWLESSRFSTSAEGKRKKKKKDMVSGKSDAMEVML